MNFLMNTKKYYVLKSPWLFFYISWEFRLYQSTQNLKYIISFQNDRINTKILELTIFLSPQLLKPSLSSQKKCVTSTWKIRYFYSRELIDFLNIITYIKEIFFLPSLIRSTATCVMKQVNFFITGLGSMKWY